MAIIGLILLVLCAFSFIHAFLIVTVDRLYGSHFRRDDLISGRGPPYQCSYCGNSYSRRDNALRHLKEHRRDFLRHFVCLFGLWILSLLVLFVCGEQPELKIR